MPIYTRGTKNASLLAELAVSALVDEAMLTPKPALVDRRGTGAHQDMDLELMIRSAHALQQTFEAFADTAAGRLPSQSLREELAVIGRIGERIMLTTAAGVNTHRGSIWALGLLVAAVAICRNECTSSAIGKVAGTLARYPDRNAPERRSHGTKMIERYGVTGARGEAAAGFPHVINFGLPALRKGRLAGGSEQLARVNALLVIMASLDDTCLLYRAGPVALRTAKRGASEILASGSLATVLGQRTFAKVETQLIGLNASPGGSADLFAATLFLDRICKN
jgi:triphosphoribosyl-dephospho-CoA synthase